MRLTIAAGLFAFSFAVAGCGSKPKLVTVTGKVIHNGKTVTGGSVWFHLEGADEGRPEKMNGQLQLDGTFTAKTFPHGDGIPPGKYKVTLSPDLAARAGVPNYGVVARTPWSVEVTDAGLADKVFEIK